jgi:hypothetical protein
MVNRSQRFFFLRARYETTNSPRVVLDGEGDLKRAHDGDRVASNLGISGRELQGMKSVGKCPNGCGMMSASSTCGWFGAGRATVAR